jgi:protein-S-isoprenylcysteine O-methyltransferase Ste14
MWLSLIGIVASVIIFVGGVMVSLTYSERVGDMDVERGKWIMGFAALLAFGSIANFVWWWRG